MPDEPFLHSIQPSPDDPDTPRCLYPHLLEENGRWLLPSDEPTQRRNWRLFLALDSVLLLTALAVTWAIFTFRPATWVVPPVCILWMWLIVTLPICFLYLIGHPPVITLSPLIPSAQTRTFRRDLKERPALPDDEFDAQYYQGSRIPAHVPAGVRRCLSEIDWLAERAVPSDPLWLLYEELDYADVLRCVGKEFGVEITEEDYAEVDGTLDNLIRLVAARLGQGLQR